VKYREPVPVLHRIPRADRTDPVRAEARSFDAVADAIGTAYLAVTAQDCRGFYRDAGYNL